ncbi:acyloxyacyl hydrolase [Methylocapsa sp. S129]|uniref:acyloxyacyl hydrolase n=1 Tax=Methylocapsa sp. S129 TaxID=1641869 RepID=UPI00131D3E99|nr:acyloxyacyl hydrolase [Methylocapsa sp. S129]
MGTRFSVALLSVGFAVVSGLLSGCSSLPQQAANGPSSAYPLSEVRLGALDHDPLSPERGSVDVSAEALFVKPFTSSDPLWNALLPRPDIGGTVNFDRKTSEAYAGLAWDYNVTDRVFVEGALGGSVNDGHFGAIIPPGFNDMGCDVSFRESASLGYRLTQNWSVMTTIEHMSNAGLCAENRGLTNMGARIGYAF